MFQRQRRKEKTKISYDPEQEYPVIRCSICNGEQVAGLKDRKTGAFHEIMLIRDEKDRAVFEQMVGTDRIEKVY